MGQKKCSAASRHVASSNGSLPPSALESSAGSPASNDVEASSNGSETALNLDGSFVTVGELVLIKGKTETAKSEGGLEFSNEEVLSVRSDCEKALVALRRGNSSKALKLIRDAGSKYENNALVQRVHGHICFRLASMIEDATTKQRHLKEAIEAAHKAVLLSPRSVEYAQFYAQLLFDVATDNRGYDEVIQECKRALEIEDPIDPAKESLHEEGQHKLPTAEARIGQVHEELQNLLQKANIASISNWMKTLGNGGSEEKLRFIHMRKLVDDPMEQRVSQPKRPHEVKKSVKTPEEKRKDIEVRVAAARLLQQKRDCSPPHSDEGDLKSTRGGTRLERRRSGGSNNRKVSQADSPEEKIERLKPFWNALGPKGRERMLEIPLDTLKQQYSTSKMILTSELLNEALEFARERKTWRFWMCCSCGERFIDGHEHAEHIMDKHINSLSPKLRRLLPHEIDPDVAEQIVAQDCQPFDGPSAIKLLIDSAQPDAEGGSLADHDCIIAEEHGRDGVANNGSVSSTEIILDSSGDAFLNSVGDATGELAAAEPLSSSLANGENHNQADDKPCMCDSKCGKSKRVLQVGKDLSRLEFPLADDEERKKFLQKISNLFGILIRNKCLASDHMEKIVQYAVDELQGFKSDSSVQYELNPSPVYIRFLPAPQLRRIFGYLRELVNACGLDQLSDSAPPSSPSQNEEEDVILDRLFLNGNFTALTLDERLLKEDSGKPMESLHSSGSLKHHSSCHVKDPPSSSSSNLKEEGTISQTDLQLSWIYQKVDYEHQPAGWKQFKEARVQQARDILRALEKEFLSLQTFCERKREHLQYEEAVVMAESLCIEELKKRELKGENFLGHEAVLRKHQQEILESQTTGLSSQQKLELDVIRSILREAQTISLPQFPYESAIAVTSTRLSDSEEEEEDSWKVPDFVPQLDPCIEVAIQRQKERATSEVNKLDARILRSMDSVQRLEGRLGNVSVLDYRTIILPLVKSFLKGQLEEAAEKDALQKSDAARDAFLAELSRDEKMTSEKLLNFGRNSRDKPKDKKKNKEQRRVRDGKRVSGVAVHGPQKATENESAADSVGDSCDDDKDGIDGAVVDEAQQIMEAELRRQAEVEEEERRLAETLELQRRVEEEAKERHLAELKKKQAEKEALTYVSVVMPNGTLLQDNGSVSRDSYNPALVSEEDAVAQSTECTQKLENVEFYGSLRSTSPKVDEGTDSCVTVPVETFKSGSHVRPTFGQGHSEVVMPDVTGRPTNALPGLEFPDSSTWRAKKSGKSRRRKASRGAQDDNSARNGNEDHRIGSGGQSSEQMTRPLMNNERGFSNAADDGDKQTEPGLAWKKKQASNEDGTSSKVHGGTTHSPNKTLRELKAEQDAEERFQADLEQALQQSLANIAELSTEVFRSESMRNEHVAVAVAERKISFEEVGKGLQNESGQYNCFLNVVIQSLWHLRRFREEILAMSSTNHVHIGEPCVVCALRDIFVGLNSPSSDMNREAIAPTTLRIALSNLYSQKDFFQQAQMNDASEVLAVVFDCLHKAFTGNMVLSDGDSDASSGIGFWECQDHTSCIAHSLFSLDIAMQMNCTNCGLESRHLKYTSFFHNINASSLRTAKVLYQESSLDELLRLVDMNQFLGCDLEVGGCGQQNYIHYLLRAAPHVFITVLGWQNSRETLEDISATMDAIGVDMDVGVVYRGLDRGFKHRLVSVICYYGQHYHCFAFNHEIGRWVMFDDITVKVIGTYEDVVDTCRRGHLQPQVLFYEAV